VLRLAVVADRSTDRIDAGRERRLGNGAAAPDGSDELVFADDTFTIAQEVLEQIEYLRRQGHEAHDATELAPFRIKRAILEKIAQAVSLKFSGHGERPPINFSMVGFPRVKMPVRKM
jgi:hypothetical protein